MEVPSVIVFLFFYFQGENCFEPVPFVFLVVWQTHYFQRSFIYPLFLMKSCPGRKQNLLLVAIGATFNSINSYLNATMISSIGNYPITYFYTPTFIFGLILFIIGYNINRRSDAILQDLRAKSKLYKNQNIIKSIRKQKLIDNARRNRSRSTDNSNDGPTHIEKYNEHINLTDTDDTSYEGDDSDASSTSMNDTDDTDAVITNNLSYADIKTKKSKSLIDEHTGHSNETFIDPSGSFYKIPYGGFFRYVGSPNYLGELIEWIAWTIMTWSLAGFSFFTFSAGNLVPRAYWNDRWYRKNFKTYPTERKRIVPFVW